MLQVKQRNQMSIAKQNDGKMIALCLFSCWTDFCQPSLCLSLYQLSKGPAAAYGFDKKKRKKNSALHASVRALLPRQAYLNSVTTEQ